MGKAKRVKEIHANEPRAQYRWTPGPNRNQRRRNGQVASSTRKRLRDNDVKAHWLEVRKAQARMAQMAEERGINL